MKINFKNTNANTDYVIISRLFDLEHNVILWLTKMIPNCPKDLSCGGKMTYINNPIFKTLMKYVAKQITDLSIS